MTAGHPPTVGRYRWWICALLFAASAINYIDRQVLGLLKPTLQQELGWSEIDYGNLVLTFQLAYAIGLLSWGRIVDRIGPGAGFTFLSWCGAWQRRDTGRPSPSVDRQRRSSASPALP